MKFFSKKFLDEEMILALKESRKVYVKNKVVNYNDNFIELINFEECLRVYPEQDELLDMINDIKLFDEWERLDWVLEYGYDANYDYSNLPKKLRNYMQEMDALFFARWMNRVKRSPCNYNYDAREERLEKMIPEYSEEEYKRHVILGQPVPSTLGKKAKDSARRSYKKVREICSANVHTFDTFVTLTFAMEKNKTKLQHLNSKKLDEEVNLEFDYVNPKDFDTVVKCYSKFQNSLKRACKRKGIPFEAITVWELQDNGNYHFHMLCSGIPKELTYKVPTWLDYDYRKNTFNNGHGLIHWTYGKSDVQKIKSHEKISTYVSKYIIKSFLNVNEDTYEQYLHRKKYYPTKGLVRSTENWVTDKEVDKVMKDMEIAQKVAYEREYTNPYNESKITKRIYTMV